MKKYYLVISLLNRGMVVMPNSYSNLKVAQDVQRQAERSGYDVLIVEGEA